MWLHQEFKESYPLKYFKDTLYYDTQAAKRKITSSSSDQGILKNWFPGWIPGGSSSDTVTSESVIPSGSEEEDDPKKLSEEDQLLEELGYEAKDNLFLRDRIFLTMNFSLVGGSFQLVTTPSSLADSFFGPEPLVEMAFKSLNFSIDLRPRLKYGSCDLSLGSLTVTDHSHSDSLFPILVQPKGSKVRISILVKGGYMESMYFGKL